MTDAHTETEHLTLIDAWPAHEPRETDVHYHIFNATRARLARLGLLHCWIGNADCRGAVELHHDEVEFSLIEDVDVAKFMAAYPAYGVTDDESFKAWVEGEGNLLPLCAMHHRGIIGIHSIRYPAWKIQRVMKDGIVPPERKV